ncbi:unnamed protein product [Parnassius apollo]|uniref:(apollo) hypothetical protein n=1 Tax=Parnassius apollo TaxID=110799 RepID=A0A8S3X2N6_PARAO|nr:unnamed protein product [Parnassius apollo]
MTTREVELTGGAPWGFRMHGGADQNQPLRISRSYSYPEPVYNVNPGRKASLSGIREGDVISSINGQPTKTMTNADAHAMLRSAGPVLRLGLNEDREMSPRRRSIGRTSELKRPSHLLSEVNNKIATLQAPVYATIRPSNSSQNRPTQSLSQSSLNSLPATLNSTSLVKSGAANEEPFHFHPTNPFYTTVSSNHSSASKLPIPNGRASFSSLDRSKSISKPKENFLLNEQYLNGKSPSYISLTDDSGPHSTIFSNYVDMGNTNGYDSETSNLNYNVKDGHFIRDNNSKIIEATNRCDVSNEIKFNEKNPFQTKRNSDPFEKYFRPNGKNIENSQEEKASVPNSISDSDIHKNEQKTNHLTVTEHKISETEEITTIKKIVLNGASENETQDEKSNKLNIPSHSEPTKNKYSVQDTLPSKEFYMNIQYSPQKDLNSKSTLNSNNYFVCNDKHDNEFNKYPNKPLQEERNNYFKAAETSTGELVVTKPPLKSPSVPATVSLVPKRE